MRCFAPGVPTINFDRLRATNWPLNFAKWCTRNNGSPTLNTVGLAVLVVVLTVHFGVGSVLAIAAAALGRSLTAAVVASDLGQLHFATTLE